MIGHVIGARPTTSTRRSVIFKSDGLELVLTFCGIASNMSVADAMVDRLAHDPTPAATVCFRKERRPLPHVTDDFITNLLSSSCSSTQVPRCQGAKVPRCHG